jgi:hypothetical protein
VIRVLKGVPKDDPDMRKLRFNIASLLVIILFLGVGFAALRESNDLWESGIFSLTFGTLMVSILFAVHRAESRRAFWLGFALFGWGYMGLIFMPLIESRLITTRALAYLDSKVPGRATRIVTYYISGTVSGTPNDPVQGVVFGTGNNPPNTSSQGSWIRELTPNGLLSGWGGTTENFVRIGHSLFALLAAWLGGSLSRRLREASRQTEVSTAVEAAAIR